MVTFFSSFFFFFFFFFYSFHSFVSSNRHSNSKDYFKYYTGDEELRGYDIYHQPEASLSAAELLGQAPFCLTVLKFPGWEHEKEIVALFHDLNPKIILRKCKDKERNLLNLTVEFETKTQAETGERQKSIKFNTNTTTMVHIF